MKDYQDQNPGVNMHHAIDIIRPKADQDYLDAVTYHCGQEDFDTENNQQNEEGENSQLLKKTIIYLDRNNTPDVWPDIHRTIEQANKGRKFRDFKTILILPEQHPSFDASLYHTQNPICPQMIFECIKRIFGRKSHDCLSSDNKPKVAEVILKFAKLYDGVDFSKDEQMRKYFDDFVRLDFLNFNKRDDLQPETIHAMIECYNATPPNFECPSDEIIE